MSMFCNQCEEALNNQGCQTIGVCGKPEHTSKLQDLLVHLLKGLSVYQLEAHNQEKATPDIDRFITQALFMTISNVNFDDQRFVQTIRTCVDYRNALKEFKVETARYESMALTWSPITEADIIVKSHAEEIHHYGDNEDILSLKELVIYGVKGMAAYVKHAENLEYENHAIYRFISKALAKTLEHSISIDQLLDLVMETGKFGVEAMALLDKANTETYGHPELTKVNLGVRQNPGILISGHDLNDLEELLEQTEGSGVDVYTHCEMLPAHFYPVFKKYDHFVANYGNAWWQQREEFESFNGPILFTTNCLVPPFEKSTYKDKVYTTGSVGFPGFKHIKTDINGKKDYADIIAQAKTCQPPKELESGELVGGFAHNQVLALADQVVEAVKSGAIKQFFVMAGCDGRMPRREYYTEFAKELPADTIILTAGCAKFRYNKLPLGDINGIPRVLDAGQCNDSYSLAVIALKLKEVFELEDINDLPISYNIAWYEQKAVIVLLALLSLGVKNIHLGPTLPSFLSPNVASVLVEKFGIAGIGTPKEDVELFLGSAASS